VIDDEEQYITCTIVKEQMHRASDNLNIYSKIQKNESK
jgi:hypothetical protein